VRHQTTRTRSASTACHICPQWISTAGPILPQRIRTHQLRWPWRTGTRTWTRLLPRPTRIQCRTCTPHHIYHGVEGTRVHGTTSGHRRRILCAAAPGIASPGPTVLKPHETICKLECMLFLWFRRGGWSYQPDVPPTLEEAGQRLLLHPAECAAVRQCGVRVQHEEPPQNVSPRCDG
jgi:hypothetical protein